MDRCDYISIHPLPGLVLVFSAYNSQLITINEYTTMQAIALHCLIRVRL